jgi:hypothetical protein
VFISYAHADREIAKALRKELIEVNRDRVGCFLDSESIPGGEQFEPIISREIRRADWLIVLFTGEQSEYCGFEIGMFVQMRTGKRKRHTKLVCLHDSEGVPTLFRNHQNTRVVDPTPGTGTEEDFYVNSPVAKLLREFYEYDGLYPARADAADTQRKFLVNQSKTISEAFRLARGSDVKWDTSVQPRLEIHVKNFGSLSTAIPDDAELSSINGVFPIFKLQLPQDARLTWRELREHVLRPLGGITPPWLHRIERDVIDAVQQKTLSSGEATVQGDKGIFRPILARHSLYHDGSRRFYILFIESLPRLFLGKQQTSILLAGLVLASRFRFAYFEEWERMFTSKFGDGVPDADFWMNCTQLVYDIERMEHEAAEFGLLDPNELVAALGHANRATVEEFLKTWRIERNKLFSSIPIGEGVRDSSQARAATKELVLAFFRAMHPVNGKFLDIASGVYRAEMVKLLKIEQAVNGESKDEANPPA